MIAGLRVGHRRISKSWTEGVNKGGRVGGCLGGCLGGGLKIAHVEVVFRWPAKVAGYQRRDEGMKQQLNI